ncbi:MULTISPECIES: tRNA-guanine transglycosylase DpdA [unclassified Rhizobium]|uniref:tRNA-guanine transglycosylase DpdA n=1 Tax=unclassified Rhizobium TaxID=2613769 RepID=UPI0007EC1E40|nr:MULTISPECIES: tRNA-guanine transglycosylase DpdA [unclassified Rhizobium]ANM09218.1 queuine/other tRNA-ribosyltransferase protein [Rhizobium sp. N324]OYD02786.1 queuine/other tRNA-ribosyltransferase protein [Rhizobium sp. N4311]
MKFIFADSLDHVDPGYDFIRDRYSEGRTPYWDDAYPHEIMGYAPYKGMLVSRGIVGGGAVGGKYTEAQAMRFRRVGAREFLRLDKPEFAGLPIFGDCGAFTYHMEDKPPYTPEDTAEFYDDARFTHGCSVDHIIFDFDESLKGFEGGTEEARRRFEITLENASAFRTATQHMSNRFTPLGVIQGWSPGSMAEGARRLVAMGYNYLALGGTVPLKAPQIRACLAAIRDTIPDTTKLHILGFAKADEIDTFGRYNITSFDTTSPLIRAFKDAKANYYLPMRSGKLEYYTAIRVPQALENPKLMRLAKRGALNQEQLVSMEKNALSALRSYDRGESQLEETLDTVIAYATPAITGSTIEELPGMKAAKDLRDRYRRTLSDRPWQRCSCAICSALSIEVVIFRASNRNKRRGIHNLGVYNALVDQLPTNSGQNDDTQISSDPSQTERSTHSSFVCSAGV